MIILNLFSNPEVMVHLKMARDNENKKPKTKKPNNNKGKETLPLAHRKFGNSSLALSKDII